MECSTFMFVDEDCQCLGPSETEGFDGEVSLRRCCPFLLLLQQHTHRGSACAGVVSSSLLPVCVSLFVLLHLGLFLHPYLVVLLYL